MVCRVQSWRTLDLALIHRRAAERAAQSDTLATLSANDQNPLLFADNNYLARVYGSAIGPMTRKAVVHWMFKAARDSSMPCAREVAALATNYLDRVMNVIVVRHNALQGLAAGCLHLAAKFSHGVISPSPPMKGFPVDIRFELPILQALRWRLVLPTVFSFIPLLANAFWIPSRCIPVAAQYAELFITRSFLRSSHTNVTTFVPKSLLTLCAPLSDAIFTRVCIPEVFFSNSCVRITPVPRSWWPLKRDKRSVAIRLLG